MEAATIKIEGRDFQGIDIQEDRAGGGKEEGDAAQERQEQHAQHVQDAPSAGVDAGQVEPPTQAEEASETLSHLQSVTEQAADPPQSLPESHSALHPASAVPTELPGSSEPSGPPGSAVHDVSLGPPEQSQPENLTQIPHLAQQDSLEQPTQPPAQSQPDSQVIASQEQPYDQNESVDPLSQPPQTQIGRAHV